MSKHGEKPDGLFAFVADEFSVTSDESGTMFFDLTGDGEKKSFAMSFQDAIKLRVSVRTKDGKQSVSFPEIK